ncbi:MAG: helix-turn-helix domain-containing protein [Deltaproteobacteria bacterium]
MHRGVETSGPPVGGGAASGEGRPPEPYLLTIDEVASLYLRTTRKGVWHRIRRGQIPGVVRVGRRLFVRRAALVKFLQEKSVPSPWETRG